MGISIEDIEQWARQNNYTIVADEWWEAAQDTINKYHQLQADYKNRLKADMVAMLTEIQLEIEEMQGKYSPYYDEASQHTSEIIQQKINVLKGDQEDETI